MEYLPWISLGGVLLSGACILAWVLIGRRKAGNTQHAQQSFRQRREWLEAHFFSIASSSGKPRGLAWSGCDFSDGVSFARERETGQLRAFVAVTISFEAIEGGGMEDVEAVGNLRAATAVFEYDGRQWTTQGRVIFNLEPDEAIVHFQHRPLIAE